MADRPVSDPPSAKSPPPIHRQNMRRGQFGPGNPGKPFPPGHSGRPKGARNKVTTTLAAMFEGEAERIGRRAIELAEEGRVGCVKLILDRAMPARHGRPIDGVTLPAINTAADALAAMGAITTAVGAGAITAAEARDLSTLVDTFRKMHEHVDIERRLGALERRARETR